MSLDELDRLVDVHAVETTSVAGVPHNVRIRDPKRGGGVATYPRVAWVIVQTPSGDRGRRTSVSRMDIVPDDKNWTWVLERTCDVCGFDAAAVGVESIAGLIREQAEIWPTLLAAADVGIRPRPDKWSVLEYGCHVRDVFDLYDFRLHLMLDNDDPVFPNWDQDETAIEQRYHEADAATTASELVAAALRLAESFAAVTDSQWRRAGRRSDGAVFTIESFARYLIHDPIHHVYDVRAD